MIQALGVIIVYICFYFVPFGILGYLIYGLSGVYVSLFISFFIATFCLIFGESWLLALSNSIPLKKNSNLWERSLNLVSVKDLKGLTLYECRKYPNIVCVLTSILGKNSLIFGSEFLQKFSDREKDLILELSTNYMKTKPTFLRTQFSLSLALIINMTSFNSEYAIYRRMPRIIRRLLFPLIRLINGVAIFLKFLFFPISEIKKSFVRYDKVYEDIEVDPSNKADLIAVVQKLKMVSSKSKYVNELVWFALNDLALVPMGNDSSFLFNHYRTELETR